MVVNSIVAVGWCRIVGLGLIVLIVECDVVMIIKVNGWEILEDMVNLLVLVNL